MSHAEKVDTKAAVPSSSGPVAVPAAMSVGAADDVAELDADRRAEQALGWLARQRPMDQPPPTDGGTGGGGDDVGRSHASSAGASIGFAGGALDSGTATEIQGAIGGGEPLAPDVLAPMQQAFGTDLGRVRIHRSSRADRISRSISAQAFTTGNDIFFARGTYEPGSASGERVLAHELGHVMQNRLARTGTIQRLGWLDRAKAFVGITKSPHEQDVDTARDTRDSKDESARAGAAKVNAKHAEITARIKLTYEASPEAKNLKPAELTGLYAGFAQWLEKESEARSTAIEAETGDPDTDISQLPEVQAAADAAGEAAWEGCPDNIRALRPLRFDEFDKALREVAAMEQQGRDDLALATGQRQQQNDKDRGAALTPGQAQEQVLQQRTVDRRNARGASKKDNRAEVDADAQGTGDRAVADARTRGRVGASQESRLRSAAMDSAEDEAYGSDQTVDAVDDAVGSVGARAVTAGKVGSAVAKVGPQGVKALGQIGKAPSLEDAVASDDLAETAVTANLGEATKASSVIDAATAGLDSVVSMIKSVLAFSRQMSAMSKGTADRGAKVTAARDASQALKDAADATAGILESVKTGIEKFGGASTAVSSAKQGIPIVGLISSAMSVVTDSLELAPLAEKVSSGRTTVEQALLASKFPLAAAYDRLNSRNAQLVEKKSFSLAKSATMLGLNIAEVATLGGFGVPLAAKLTVGITDLAHRLGHSIYDAVSEHRAADANHAFGVEHQEGAARDVLRHDIGKSVGVLIVAAKQHKLAYARRTLEEYGVEDAEIDSMLPQEISEKVLSALAATGDPQTIGQKVEAATDTVREALGIEKSVPGAKPEKELSAAEKVRSVPGKVSGAFAAVGDYLNKKIKSVEEAHADAKALVKEKNDLGSNGRNGRGGGSVFKHMLRGGEKRESSFQKVRQQKSDRIEVQTGVTPSTDDLPQSTADRRKREELKAAASAGPDPSAPDNGISAAVPADFAAKVRDSTAAAFPEIIDKANAEALAASAALRRAEEAGDKVAAQEAKKAHSDAMAKLDYVSHEVASRTGTTVMARATP